MKRKNPKYLSPKQLASLRATFRDAGLPNDDTSLREMGYSWDPHSGYTTADFDRYLGRKPKTPRPLSSEDVARTRALFSDCGLPDPFD